MLVLKNIVKNYELGGNIIPALSGVDIAFRKSEFVSILGPSGCGKTTLLNIIGGLDKYTDGDLIINNKSTKDFSDHDWDTYRNHSIGFVFQNYNLIPHQTVLSNVELALTLSGVSKDERRKRAIDALDKVGLKDQLYKKPNQMSGGQMQRVAIARALVNDPDILLADEPTGALDSVTSVQIMDILKEISNDKLIIMVTHNPELAQTYSTRIIKLLDGIIVDDSSPFDGEEELAENNKSTKKKSASMSFFTALSLSFNNLLTKKGRTFMTGFAGSIGIIGIALILSVSTGVKTYIDRVQRDTLSSYPITIQKENIDMSGLISSLMSAEKAEEETSHDLDKVYVSSIMYHLVNSLKDIETKMNNIKDFKKFLDTNETFQKYAMALKYSYQLDLNIYTEDKNGNVVKSDPSKLFEGMMGAQSNGMGSNMMMSSSSYKVWEELLKGKDSLVNEVLSSQYDVLYGKWPEKYNEVVLIVDSKNELSDIVLYTLGLRTYDEMMDIVNSAMNEGEHLDTSNLGSWTYEELCNMTFKAVLAADRYQKQNDGTYKDLSTTDTGLQYLYNSDKAIDIKIVGIIRPNSDSVSSMVDGSIGYTSALTEYIINQNNRNELLQNQLADKDNDIISGLPFKKDVKDPTDEEKISLVKDYFSKLNLNKKAEIFVQIKATPTEQYIADELSKQLALLNDEMIKTLLVKSFALQMGVDEEKVVSYVEDMSSEKRIEYASVILKAQITKTYEETVKNQLSSIDNEQLATMFDNEKFTDEQYVDFYGQFMPSSFSNSNYEKNLDLLGYIDIDDPDYVSIYAGSFENKEKLTEAITQYNDSVQSNDKITYTDIVELMMSSISTIIDAISYVLVAFVAISLVVSSIMIGIITYISVLERTKEIGILRAIGASKRDISRVFNAETIIVGFVAGMLGIIVTLLLLIPINIVLKILTDIAILRAILPVGAAVFLVFISMGLTVIAGLIPSKVAAKKDPVIALRTE